jgi:hypothetical protein
MTIDWKKIGMWSGIAGVAGVVGYWLYQYQQTAAANSAAQAATDSQNENQALAALMEQPLSSGGATDSSASVSGPTVDTGNNTLQALIESILNPPVAATPSTPVATTPSTPVTTTPSTPVDTNTSGPVSAPVGSGANPIQAPNSDVTQISISPAILYTIPVATGTQ